MLSWGGVLMKIVKIFKYIIFTLSIAMLNPYIHAAFADGIDIDVKACPDVCNSYGGVNIDVSVDKDINSNYEYEIKRSDDYISWSNIGMAFNYNYMSDSIIPHKINVLNVYPDNDSFKMPEGLMKKYDNDTIEIMKKVYSIPDGRYTYTDNKSKILPRSAMLKLWMEGGSYVEDNEKKSYEDLSYYNGNKMFDITQMSMKQFNAKFKTAAQLNDYDVIFFGTWDANGWNDLNETTYKLIKNYIAFGKGVIFGHDTISYEIANGGIFTNQCEADNFFKLRGSMGFNTIPEKYEYSSLIKKNNNGKILPMQYQIWGGGDKKDSVTVKFSKSKLTNDSSLTTFPYNLLTEDGQSRDLEVPITHTSWMGLDSDKYNIVSFPHNNYGILPDETQKIYESNPNMKYNWYLCSSNRNKSCFAIQTGHSKNNSMSDERKLIANVICNAYKKEKIKEMENYNGSKLDSSAQDYAPPAVNDVIITDYIGLKPVVTFSGQDYGTNYYYRAEIKSIDSAKVYKSGIKNVTVETGIKNYYYTVDAKPDNYDFALDKANKVGIAKNKSGIKCKEFSNEKIYLHVKAIDYAGNESKPVVVDLSKKISSGILPLQISTSDNKYLYKSSDKNGVRHYYVNGMSEFKIIGGCQLYPFATQQVQPYGNSVNNCGMYTKLSSSISKDINSSNFSGNISKNITVNKISQTRSVNSTLLKFELSAKFNNSTDGIEELLIPEGTIFNSNDYITITGDNKDNLLLTCDTKGPEISIGEFNFYYNKYNYKNAFSVMLCQADSGSGIDKTTVSLNKYENNIWNTIAAQESRNLSKTIGFLSFAGEGIYKYEVTGSDNVGNVTKKNINFCVDKTAPVIDNISNCYGWTNNSVCLNVTATDNMSGVDEISLYDINNNLIKSSYSSMISLEFDNEQNNEYYLTVSDNAGNISDKYVFWVKIDKTMPDITGSNICSENYKKEGDKEIYYLPDNNISALASDNKNNGFYSGVRALVLKDAKGNIICKVENADSSDILKIDYEVKDYKDSDFYYLSAIDFAGNIRTIYIIPECCKQNRIRRYIDHDNYEQEYGYFRVYE